MWVELVWGKGNPETLFLKAWQKMTCTASSKNVWLVVVVGGLTHRPKFQKPKQK